MTTASKKQQIRSRILAAREQLPADVRAAQNTAITERLLHLPAYLEADTVLGYMNFGSEYASERWVAQALSGGKRVALPKVNRRTNRLDLYWVENLQHQLEIGLWGIREPVIERCERANDINEVEFVLLPGIAFSRDGARLGYGGGFYDKLLAHVSHRTTRVTAAFGLQIISQIPQESTDIGVQHIVTETETIDCNSKSLRSDSC